MDTFYGFFIANNISYWALLYVDINDQFLKACGA